MISKNLTKLIRSLENKKSRERYGLFVAEGPKTVGDLAAVSQPKTVIATAEWLEKHATETAAEYIVATDEELRKVSFLQHPQHVLGIFPIPQKKFNAEICNRELCLALDKVQDPGNLGTIIRIADWFGISTILCNEGTADAFNPKAVQATMGSIARVSVVVLLMQTPSLYLQLPFVCVFSVAAGVIVGVLTILSVKHLPERLTNYK